jgi:hypothetical protein
MNVSAGGYSAGNQGVTLRENYMTVLIHTQPDPSPMVSTITTISG